MNDWQSALAPYAHDLEQIFDRLKHRLVSQLGGPGPIKIVPYRGYGVNDRLYLKGRVLEDKGDTLAQENDRLWQNLLNMYRRLATHEIPNARLKARFQGSEWDLQANEEGFFDARLDLPEPLRTGQLWHRVELELAGPGSARQAGPVRGTGEVLVPPPAARFVVISDIDDTVIQTDATHLLKMARNVFLGNARTRLPFPGVAAFLRALYAGASGTEQNPLLYVSSSPWNLYDLLSEFFSLNDIPIGPILFLRDWGLSDVELVPLKNKDYKLATIRQMVAMYAHLPFILIGDSGQEDPEIYAEVANENPERIMAVYIRNVSRSQARVKAIGALAEKVVQAGSTLVLADDTLTIARHAVQQGWIAPDALPGIQVEKKVDEAPASPLDTLLQKEKKAEGPTVVVRGETRDGKVDETELRSALKEGDDKTEKPPTVVVKPGKEQKPQNQQ